MKIVRTIVWVLLLVALAIFSVNNWNPVEVKIWEGLILETKIPALVVIVFLIGLVPMWLLHLASRWNNERRIASLESSARAAMAPPAAPPPRPVPMAEPAPEEPSTELSPSDEPKPSP